jgi:hypothetical protein
MKNRIVSKVGAKYLHKKEVKFLHEEKQIKQVENIEEEKSVQKKRTYWKPKEKLGTDFHVDIEDENLDGVSV